MLEKDRQNTWLNAVRILNYGHSLHISEREEFDQTVSEEVGDTVLQQSLNKRQALRGQQTLTDVPWTTVIKWTVVWHSILMPCNILPYKISV